MVNAYLAHNIVINQEIYVFVLQQMLSFLQEHQDVQFQLVILTVNGINNNKYVNALHLINGFTESVNYYKIVVQIVSGMEFNVYAIMDTGKLETFVSLQDRLLTALIIQILMESTADVEILSSPLMGNANAAHQGLSIMVNNVNQLNHAFQIGPGIHHSLVVSTLNHNAPKINNGMVQVVNVDKDISISILLAKHVQQVLSLMEDNVLKDNLIKGVQDLINILMAMFVFVSLDTGN